MNISQVPAAAAEEGGAIPPHESHRGGEQQLWEDHPHQAADEAEALPAEFQTERC